MECPYEYWKSTQTFLRSKIQLIQWLGEILSKILTWFDQNGHRSLLLHGLYLVNVCHKQTWRPNWQNCHRALNKTIKNLLLKHHHQTFNFLNVDPTHHSRALKNSWISFELWSIRNPTTNAKPDRIRSFWWQLSCFGYRLRRRISYWETFQSSIVIEIEWVGQD